MEQPHLEIRFKDPNRVLQNEKRSKLINPDCTLYQYLTYARKEFLVKFPGQIDDPPRMDFHIEVITANELYSETKVLARVAELEGKPFVPKFIQCGKAIAFETLAVSGYGPTHITVAWFRQGIPESLKDLFNTV